MDDTCWRCGARLGPDVAWCGQCYAPRAPAEALAVGSPAGSREPLAEGQEDQPVVRYSRWRGGPTSFGPVGKILITAVVVFFGWLTYVSFKVLDGALVVADFGFYAVLAAVVLRHLWKRARVE